MGYRLRPWRSRRQPLWGLQMTGGRMDKAGRSWRGSVDLADETPGFIGLGHKGLLTAASHV